MPRVRQKRASSTAKNEITGEGEAQHQAVHYQPGFWLPIEVASSPKGHGQQQRKEPTVFLEKGAGLEQELRQKRNFLIQIGKYLRKLGNDIHQQDDHGNTAGAKENHRVDHRGDQTLPEGSAPFKILRQPFRNGAEGGTGFPRPDHVVGKFAKDIPVFADGSGEVGASLNFSEKVLDHPRKDFMRLIRADQRQRPIYRQTCLEQVREVIEKADDVIFRYAPWPAALNEP